MAARALLGWHAAACLEAVAGSAVAVQGVPNCCSQHCVRPPHTHHPQLLTWRVPWEGAEFWLIVSAVTRGERLPIPAPADLPGPDTQQVRRLRGLGAWAAPLARMLVWPGAVHRRMHRAPSSSLQFAGLGSYCDLLQRCWAQAPADRPALAEVVQELRRLAEHAAGGALRLPPSRTASLASS